MRAFLARLVNAVFVLVGIAFVPSSAYGCDCVRLTPLSPKVRQEAPFIVEGVAIEIVERSEHTLTTSRNGSSGSVRPLDRVVVFEVAAAWNGVESARFSVLAEMSDCVFPFEIGGRYLVFANRHSSGRAETSICSRTTALKDAGPILRALGPPTYRPVSRH
jgi:hypothetical protein